MSNTVALIKLELKARYGMRGVPRKKAILKYTFSTLLFGGIYVLLLFGIQSLISMFHVYHMDYQFMLAYHAVFEVGMLAVSISSTVKSLYHSGDNELLLRFPVTGRSMYIAKAVTLAVGATIATLTLLMPAAVIFGVTANVGWRYYLLLPVYLAVSGAIPTIVANLLAIPAMEIGAKIKHFHLFNLVVSVILLGAFFAVYVTLFETVVGFLQGESLTVMSEGGMKKLGFLHYIYPLSLPVDMLVRTVPDNILRKMTESPEPLALSIPVSLAEVALLGVASLLVIRKWYLSTVLKNIEAESASFVRHTRNRQRGVIASIFHREFLDIFRSNNHSFQYLAMACAAPVMVYFCNRLAIDVGSTSLDKVTVPALTMLVLFIFVTITVSFAGSCVSREGEAFYLTKISPAAVKWQILVKMGLYLLVAAGSIIISMTVVMATKQVPVSYGFSIIGIGLLFALALTAFAIKLDMVHPQFPVGGDGENAGGSLATIATLGIGLVLSVLLGLVGLVGSALPTIGAPFTLGMEAVVVFALAAAAVTWLSVGLSKSYNKIEQR